jgi:hypothetical protein
MREQALPDCTGYRVVMRDGRVGTVAAVLPLAYGQQGGLLIVHAGPSCGLTAMSVDELEDVDVRERRLVARNPTQ